jgi:hypothetical protein
MPTCLKPRQTLKSPAIILQVAARGARILARLHVYQAVAKFQVAAEEAVRGHAEGTETPLRHIHVTCTQAGTALQGLAQALMTCPARQRSVRPAAIGALGPEGEASLIAIPLPSPPLPSFKYKAILSSAGFSHVLVPHLSNTGYLARLRGPVHVFVHTAQPRSCGQACDTVGVFFLYSVGTIFKQGARVHFPSPCKL